MSNFIIDNVMTYADFTLSSIRVEIEKPNKCPCCHTIINPEVVGSSKINREETFAVLFRCPSCKKYFFKSYLYYSSGTGNKSKDFDSTPTLELNLDIPKEIKNISPKFSEIYTQALTAEFYGLFEITGIGLRKSIEFFVKDYLINFKGKDKDKISKMNLGSAFKEIDNPMISPLITASVWLGNDEAHYIRKHEDKDINDMKKFVESIIYFISCELKVSDALKMIDSSIAK